MKRHICDSFIRRYTPVLHFLCQKLGIPKMGPKHHPSMSDADKSITHRLLFYEYASVYIFHQLHYIIEEYWYIHVIYCTC